MNYKIVPMTEAHIDEAVKAEEICFSVPLTKEGFERELKNENSHYLVAAGEKVLGYIGVHEIAGEAYIHNIAVLPEYRRAGIGRAMLESACDGARERGCEFITLEVRQSNAPAIALYEKCGFAKAGVRKNFYSKPAEDGVIYTKYFRGEV